MSEELSLASRVFLRYLSERNRLAHIAAETQLRNSHSDNEVPTGWLGGSFEQVMPAKPRLRPEVTIAEPLGPPPGSPGGPGAVSDSGDHHVITPGTGTIQIVPGLVTFTVDVPTPRVVVTPPKPTLPWLDSAAVCVPKSIREPFLGDLREDLAAMTVRGDSQTAIRWAAISQVVWLVLRWVWSSGLLRR